MDIETIDTTCYTTVSSMSVENDSGVKHSKYVSPEPDILKKFVTEFLQNDLSTNEKIDNMFKTLTRKYRITPSKPDMRRCYEQNFSSINMSLVMKRWLIKRSVRSQSGVLVVTIVLSPHVFSCRYNCSYCPMETDLNGNATQPRSYLSNEPAMMRALRYDFEVKGQFQNRINTYYHTGNINSSDTNSKKIEVILSGGTWESYPKEYREQVILELYWAANTCGFHERAPKTLEEEIHENETAMFRIIGLTIETRPDNISPMSLRDYRRWGVTRVQIGVQHYNDEILRKMNRMCYTRHTIRAIRYLKQCGLKVVVHLMPDLPGSNPELDKWMFEQAINNDDYQFDDIKIYPTAVCKSSDPNLIVSSEIGNMYKDGSYVPYAEKNLNDLIDVIVHYKSNVNPWVRIQRVVRDIPATAIDSGYNKKTNLHQMVDERMKMNNQKSYCIRNMEIRDMELENYKPYLIVRQYNASEGVEYHVSIEAHNMNTCDYIKYYWFMFVSFLIWLWSGKMRYWSGNLNTYVGLFGFLRLRFDPEPGGKNGDIIPELVGCSLVREVHVYGMSLGVGTDSVGSQHRGYGKLLMKTAENISQMNDYRTSAVIAGVGTREYYKNKCGYHLGETYMLKNLSKHNDNIIVRFVILTVVTFVIIQILRYLFI